MLKKGYPRNTKGINQYVKGTAYKKKGEPITMRLPLELDDGLRKMAQEQGESLAVLLANAVTLLLKEAELGAGSKDQSAIETADQTKPAATD